MLNPCRAVRACRFSGRRRSSSTAKIAPPASCENGQARIRGGGAPRVLGRHVAKSAFGLAPPSTTTACQCRHDGHRPPPKLCYRTGCFAAGLEPIRLSAVYSDERALLRHSIGLAGLSGDTDRGARHQARAEPHRDTAGSFPRSVHRLAFQLIQHPNHSPMPRCRFKRILHVNQRAVTDY